MQLTNNVPLWDLGESSDPVHVPNRNRGLKSSSNSRTWDLTESSAPAQGSPKSSAAAQGSPKDCPNRPSFSNRSTQASERNALHEQVAQRHTFPHPAPTKELCERALDLQRRTFDKMSTMSTKPAFRGDDGSILPEEDLAVYSEPAGVVPQVSNGKRAGPFASLSVASKGGLPLKTAPQERQLFQPQEAPWERPSFQHSDAGSDSAPSKGCLPWERPSFQVEGEDRSSAKASKSTSQAPWERPSFNSEGPYGNPSEGPSSFNGNKPEPPVWERPSFDQGQSRIKTCGGYSSHTRQDQVARLRPSFDVSEGEVRPASFDGVCAERLRNRTDGGLGAPLESWSFQKAPWES